MKRGISLLLCLLLIASLTVTVQASGQDFQLGQTWDSSILAGGTYDLYVWVGDNPDDYTYQWQADMGFGKGHWFDLEDNANPYGYAGTDTYHMQFITGMNDGQIIGTGWEEIPFQCVVTHKKTGVSKTTPNIFMHIYTSSNLTDYMKEKKIELYTPSITGAAKVTTTDDVTYYTSAEAGKALQFSCGFNPPQNDPLMGRSEMVGNVEVWITENGKTFKCENGGSYTPYTIGANSVSVQFKLHYQLGIHDLGYFETKTVKLSTAEPTVIGRGTAKQEMSLLKDPYSQSQKLTTIPKGQTVHVHTNSGSWYQVSYNGYVGYVGGSSLNYEDYSPIIDHVQLTVDAPSAGAKPATSCSITPNSCYVSYIDWFDKTDDRFLTAGDSFQKDHVYQLIVWATAKDDHEFKLDGNDNMLTTATINGNLPAFTYRAYEQIIGKVIEIRYDFPPAKEPHRCAPTLIPRVEPTCTQYGFEAYYYCDCAMCYSDPQGKNPVDIVNWGRIPPLGHLESAYQVESDMHYKVCIRPGCGAELTEYRDYHRGGSATCQQPATCTVCGTKYGDKTGHKWTETPVYQEASGHALSCQYPQCTAHDELKPHIPGPEATDTQPQICTVCQYILVPAKNHTHELTLVPEVAPTCTEPGVKAYYTCSGCSDRFWDEAGKEQISDRNDVILQPLGHFAEQWQSQAESHWQNCIACLTEFGKDSHSDEDQDQKCDVCSRALTETPAPTDPKETDKPIQPDITADSGESADWYVWALVCFILFAGSLIATVLILQRKKKS